MFREEEFRVESRLETFQVEITSRARERERERERDERLDANFQSHCN